MLLWLIYYGTVLILQVVNISAAFEIIDNGKDGCQVIKDFDCWSSSGISYGGGTDTCDANGVWVNLGGPGEYMSGVTSCCTDEDEVDIDCLVRFKSKICYTAPWLTEQPMQVYFDDRTRGETFVQSGQALLRSNSAPRGGYELSCNTTNIKRIKRPREPGDLGIGGIVGLSVGLPLTAAILVVALLCCCCGNRESYYQTGFVTGSTTRHPRYSQSRDSRPTTATALSNQTFRSRNNTSPSAPNGHTISPLHQLDQTNNVPEDHPLQQSDRPAFLDYHLPPNVSYGSSNTSPSARTGDTTNGSPSHQLDSTNNVPEDHPLQQSNRPVFLDYHLPPNVPYGSSNTSPSARTGDTTNGSPSHQLDSTNNRSEGHPLQQSNQPVFLDYHLPPSVRTGASTQISSHYPQSRQRQREEVPSYLSVMQQETQNPGPQLDDQSSSTVDLTAPPDQDNQHSSSEEPRAIQRQESELPSYADIMQQQPPGYSTAI